MPRTTADRDGQELAGLLRTQWEPRRNTLTMRRLGALLGVSHTTVGRWFTGVTVPDVDQVAAVLGHLGVDGDERTRILTVARRTAIAPADGVATKSNSTRLEELLEVERTACSVVEWSPLLIPELLRTADYGRATIVCEAPTLKDAE